MTILIESNPSICTAWVSECMSGLHFHTLTKFLAHNSTIVSIKGHTALVNEKGALSGPSFLFSQMGIRYCLSNLKSLFASAIWLSTNPVFHIHFSLVMPTSLST